MPYLERRRFGDAIVTAISETTYLSAYFREVPIDDSQRRALGVDDAGSLRFGQNVVHIKLRDASILVDAGLDDPGSAWDVRESARTRGWKRSPGLRAGLESIGVLPDDITHVLITHAHYDHFVGVTVERGGEHVPRFPRARYLLGRADWEDNPECSRSDSDLSMRLGAVAQYGLLDLLDSDEEIVPGVMALHSPGESPGHAIARVASQGETLYVLGDLFHHESEVEHLDWSAPWCDRRALRLSRDQLVRRALIEHATLVYAHHVFPPWGRITANRTELHWEPV